MLPAQLSGDQALAWLNQALEPHRSRHGWGDLTAVTATPIGTGQMGSNIRLRLTWSSPTDSAPASTSPSDSTPASTPSSASGPAGTHPPATMVAKLPADDPISRATGAERGSYEREVRFYQELADRLEIKVPACYYAAYDPADGDFVLLLEDMHPATQGDQLTGASPERAAAVLAEAAGLHGPLWGRDELTQITFLDPPSTETASAAAAIYRHFLPAFLERQQGHLSDQIIDAAQRFTPVVTTWATPPLPQHRTVVHGDYRLDNMLLPAEVTGRPAIVDWQTVTIGRGVRDIAYYLTTGLSREDRRRHEEDLVREYHSRLRTAGITHYPFEQCWLDYRRNAMAALFMAVIASGLVVQTSRGDEMFRVMATGAAQAAIDHDSLMLLDE